ncbi:hypothetical protein F5B19DRAFT_456100 [Rostrohypoxylon terebratum]|nr:hypothetical protein F5B19DRAFT_456100 [Rostrohypoxylon terebratum]
MIHMHSFYWMFLSHLSSNLSLGAGQISNGLLVDIYIPLTGRDGSFAEPAISSHCRQCRVMRSRAQSSSSHLISSRPV